MRRYLAGALSLSLAACAAPQHRVADAGDPLVERNPNPTLSEQIAQESQGDGCLVAGNAGRNRSDGLLGASNPCRELAEMIAPPPPPPTPPPPPQFP